jgi:hypothetical protein
MSSFDNIDKNKLIDEIPNIIKLAQRVEYIQNYVDYTINDYEHDLPQIDGDIEEDTELTTSQLNVLRAILELQELNRVWEIYRDNKILNNSDIKYPYALAYQIRELLDTPIYKDEDNDEFIWLNEKELKCIKKYNNKMNKPIIANKCEDHVIICIKCKEIIKNNEHEKSDDETEVSENEATDNKEMVLA